MRTVIISDTHGCHEEVDIPQCDLLIHAGDLEIRTIKDASRFGDWWNSLEADIKICVPGNHDFLFESMPDIAANFLDNTNVLINSSIVLPNGICVSGTPYTPRFMDWAFMSEDADCSALRHYGCISPASDIIVSHGPIYGVHDLVNNKWQKAEPHVGSKVLRGLIESLESIKIDKTLNENQERYFFHGHIHGDKDAVRHTKFDNIDIFNVSVMDENYDVVHKALILEI